MKSHVRGLCILALPFLSGAAQRRHDPLDPPVIDMAASTPGPNDEAYSHHCSVKRGAIQFRECVDLRPPERMRGIWYQSFDESYLVEGATSAPAKMNVRRLRTTLELDPDAAIRRVHQRLHAQCVRAFAVEFIGRRPTKPMWMTRGQDSLWPEDLIVVDKLISVRFLHQVVATGIAMKDQDCVSTPDPLGGYRPD
jgi:hypothetical protein